MPSVADIALCDKSPLTPEERDYVRVLIGVTTVIPDDDVLDTTLWTDTEDRFESMSEWDAQYTRYWIGIYGSYGDATDVIDDEGVNVEYDRDRSRAARALYLHVLNPYPPTQATLDDLDLDNHQPENDLAGGAGGAAVTMVPINFAEWPSSRRDEFGQDDS